VGQLATELTISADEFENYDIFATPISLAFHLREFNVCPPVSQPSQCLLVNLYTDQATIAYVESMEAVLNVRFTDPAAPLCVNVQSDSIESLFAMSTSRVPGAPEPPESTVPRQTRSAEPSGSAQGRRMNKRPADETTMRRTPAKVVQRVSPPALARRALGTQPPAPSHAPASHQPSHPIRHPREEPLFLPVSQMSAADKEALHASGLGDMDADEFNAMMEDEGEEVGLNLDPPLADAPVPSVLPMSPSPALDLELDEEQGHGRGVNRIEDDIESEMGPTQSDESGKVCPSTYPFRVCVKIFCPDHPRVWGYNRCSDRCLTTDVLSRNGLLLPFAETSGIQPPFPIKLTPRLSCSSTVS
jgi:cell cycle checkpoint control protein RAD9A